ncbi:MAG: hypothetical protein DRP79_05270 [Planctomycetota bacterium]|nr:MAG: hypothetical protein DRP79_05270 [Planctomycetota bacterium]
MIAEKLRELVQSLDVLPPLPVVIQRLLEVARDPDSSAKDMGEVISTDQGFASKLLKLVNSSFYGFPGQISTISRAVVILGYDAVKNLALAVSVFEVLSKKVSTGPLDHGKFWRHCLATAAAAKLLAERSNYTSPEEAFVAGLLHDAGRLFLALYAPKALETLFEQAKNQPGRDMVEMEQELLETDHCVLGGNIAKHWKLPEPLIWAARLHHTIETEATGQAAQIGAITFLANSLAKIRGCGSGDDDYLPAVPKQMMNLLGLDDGALLRVLLEIGPEIEKAAVMLNIDLDEDSGCQRNSETCSESILLIGPTPRQIRPIRLVLESAGYHVTVEVCKTPNRKFILNAKPEILVIDMSDGGFDTDSLDNEILGSQRSVLILPESSTVRDAPSPSVNLLRAPFTIQQLLNTLKHRKAVWNG